MLWLKHVPFLWFFICFCSVNWFFIFYCCQRLLSQKRQRRGIKNTQLLLYNVWTERSATNCFYVFSNLSSQSSIFFSDKAFFCFGLKSADSLYRAISWSRKMDRGGGGGPRGGRGRGNTNWAMPKGKLTWTFLLDMGPYLARFRSRGIML